MTAQRISTPVSMCVTVCALGSAFLSSYLGLLTASSLLPRRTRHRASIDHRFAILVPAHDEAEVIGQALEALNRLDYPRDRYSVHVVADNCSDSTAELVRSGGFEVHERHDLSDPGKGPALNWLFDRVDDRPDPADAYVIVDADTTLDPDFLKEMNVALDHGSRVAQGFYSVRDSSRSATVSLRFAALACRHHTRAQGRTILGVSCGLYGNGMMFSREVLVGRRWSGHLVEDAEFQLELLLDGQVTEYVPSARLAAEMPDSLHASSTQNRRWEQGRLDLVRRFAPRLARLAIRGRGRQRRAALDALVDQIVPPLSIVVAGQTLTLLSAVALDAVTGSTHARRRTRLALASSAITAAHVLTALASVGAPARVYVSLLSAPRTIVWKISLWLSVLVSPESATWVRTQRNTVGASSGTTRGVTHET